MPAGSNSGLLGLRVAELLGPDRILLLGFDMKGSHFFGPHPAPLENTPSHRFAVFRRQFDAYQSPLPIINCTPNSALTCFPKSELRFQL